MFFQSDAAMQRRVSAHAHQVIKKIISRVASPKIIHCDGAHSADCTIGALATSTRLGGDASMIEVIEKVANYCTENLLTQISRYSTHIALLGISFRRDAVESLCKTLLILHTYLVLCVCVGVFFPFILDIKFVGRTSRGHTGGRSHRIFHPPFCGVCLNFSREKNSAIPFPRQP